MTETTQKSEKAPEPKSGKDPATFLAPAGVSGTIATPQGPMPISAVARDEEHAQELLDEQADRVENEQRRSVFDNKLTPKQMEAMSGADLRAVAANLGYKDYPLAGKRGIVDFVQKAQAGDDRFKGSTAKRS